MKTLIQQLLIGAHVRYLFLAPLRQISKVSDHIIVQVLKTTYFLRGHWVRNGSQRLQLVGSQGTVGLGVPSTNNLDRNTPTDNTAVLL